MVIYDFFTYTIYVFESPDNTSRTTNSWNGQNIVHVLKDSPFIIFCVWNP